MLLLGENDAVDSTHLYHFYYKALSLIQQQRHFRDAPVLVRLAWHASGVYGPTPPIGGSDGGRIRFAPESTDPDSNGLQAGEEGKCARENASEGDQMARANKEAIPKCDFC